MAYQLDTLTSKLKYSFSNFADNNAIHVSGKYYSYNELEQSANLIAHMIYKAVGDRRPTTVAVLGYRSFHTYAGIAGCVLAGATYLPLNPGFPLDRLKSMLSSSDCKVLIVSPECAAILANIISENSALTIICPDPAPELLSILEAQTIYKFLFPPSDFSLSRTKVDFSVSPEASVYLLFTSGTTGLPKGIPVSHRNLCAYLDNIIEAYSIDQSDRLSNMFDITFDLSVHDIFVSFLTGACMYVVPKTSLMAPAKFIQKYLITIWFSVPSLVMTMTQMRLLKSDLFPSLRLSLFCGEALPRRSAEAWLLASPNSILENLYGPTEATIAITKYRWNDSSKDQCINGIVPIGHPFKGHGVAIKHLTLPETTDNTKGELCLSGPQVTAGYLDIGQNIGRFFEFNNKWWYATGDLVSRDESGCLYYLGRLDDQIQIRGYRAELQEIDKVIRDAAGSDMAISVPKLLSPGQAECIFAFIQGSDLFYSSSDIIKFCRIKLPDYMVPTEVRFIDSLPLNLNGKIDRKALIGSL